MDTLKEITNSTAECRRCDGQGEIEIDKRSDPYSPYRDTVPCRSCGGRGYTDKRTS